ncbi:uncharacterized protein [Nicotiana tomentosiformis]|uniref:uncharacterized protein n=1 Tax=Nicotiana tomentosiformis TaxID=4098 RepID=UPI00388C4CD5
MGSYQQGRPGERFQQQQRPPCPRCGKMHLGVYYMDLPICYGCGMRGDIQRDCRLSYQNMGSCTAQPASSVDATYAVPLIARGTLAHVGLGAARGGEQSSGGPSRFYTIRDCQSSEASPDVVIGILYVQSHDVYALIDIGSTLSYVTPYVAIEFRIKPEQLHEPFSVSTLVG